jgi:hypothetical protein
MNRKNSRELFRKFPFFNPKGSLQETLMGFGFEVGDGWYKLLLRLCNKIQAELNKAPEVVRKEFRVVQVKEKFGSLRVYTQSGTNQIENEIAKAESESLRTCENCGKKGNQEGCGYWISVLCGRCRRDSNRRMAREEMKRKKKGEVVRVRTFDD